jgi:4'-phosphopantetheinyl transferase
MITDQPVGGLWCRWATESEALLLRPAAATTSLPADTPTWRRREHQAGRSLLGSLLRDVTPGTDPAVVPGPNGKPVLAAAADIGISISHSWPMVAVAVGFGADVGIDVQVAADRSGDGRSRWTWTVREACVKATGAGLAGRPWTIPVPDEDFGTWQDLRWCVLRPVAPAPSAVAWRPRRGRLQQFDERTVDDDRNTIPRGGA